MNDFSNFASECGYLVTDCFWCQALLTGLVQGALTDTLRDNFATLKQFFASSFRRLDELIGLFSEQLVLSTSVRKKHTDERAHSGKTNPYCQRILLHGFLQLFCARAVPTFEIMSDLARGRTAFFIHLSCASARVLGSPGR